MSKQLFKGIKSVLGTTFAQKTTEEKKGYIWFVRTVVETDSNPEEEGMQDANVLTDDIYDIYFGTKHYGHFQEGQFEAIDAKIKGLSNDITDLGAVIAKMAILLNLNEDYTKVGEYDSLLAAFNAFGERFNDIEKDVQAIEESLENFLVKDVAAGDKVLTVADGILSSTIGLKYESNRISLVGKEGEEIAGFDASEFVKDSVLENVELTTKEDGEKYITFTWKGDDIEDVEIKVSDFAKLYNAGTALELAEDGVTFNVKVAANNNFLSVNTNNELIVDDVTTDKTMIKEAITIKGGPLATDAVKGAFEGGVIPAGADIQSVLKALLCVEIYPATSPSTPAYSVKINAPSITANVNSGSLVEIGQTITVNAVTANAVSVNSKTQPTVSGFENGYSASIDGDIVNNSSISTEWTIGQVDGEVYKLSAKSTGFTETLPTASENAAASSCKLDSFSFVAVSGANKYEVTETAPEYTGSYTGIESYYVVSNLGGRTNDTIKYPNAKSPSISGATGVTHTATSQSSTFTVTGVYPIFTNGVSASTTDATAAAMADLASPVSGDGTKLALINKGTFAVSFAAQGLAPYKLCLPGSWKITAASAIDGFTSKYAIDCKADFVSNGTTTIKVQGKDVTYTVYEWAGKEGANRVKFTVG